MPRARRTEKSSVPGVGPRVRHATDLAFTLRHRTILLYTVSAELFKLAIFALPLTGGAMKPHLSRLLLLIAIVLATLFLSANSSGAKRSASTTGTGGVGTDPHVQIESAVAADFGSDHHRIHRSESAKTACFRADGETEEKNKLRFEIPTPVFPRETWLLGRRGPRKVVVHEGETVEPASRREHFEVFGLDLFATPHRS